MMHWIEFWEYRVQDHEADFATMFATIQYKLVRYTTRDMAVYDLKKTIRMSIK